MNPSVRPPQCDDKTLLDITMNLYLYPAVLIAHGLGIFEFIAQPPAAWPIYALRPIWKDAQRKRWPWRYWH
ncbi:TPA: hypothetical protein ACKP07_000550 [Serratia marcescens]